MKLILKSIKTTNQLNWWYYHGGTL